MNAEEKGETGEQSPAEPKKRKQRWMNIYNASMQGRAIPIQGHQRLQPGNCAKVPYELGVKLVERVKYCKRAERGDVIK